MADDYDELLARINAGVPSSPEEADPRKPIGVPEGYIVPRVEPRRSVGRAAGDVNYLPPGTVTGIPPRYLNGDEFTPGSQSPEDVARLQRRLWQAGLLDDDFSVGVWDSASVRGYRALLTFANSSGLEWQEALARYGEMFDAETGGRFRPGDQAPEAPLPIRLTNPADVRNTAENVARHLLGRSNIDPAFVERMVAAYHTAETSYQRTVDAGGTAVSPPDLASFLGDAVRNENPTEVQAHTVAGQVADDFMSIIGGFGG